MELGAHVGRIHRFKHSTPGHGFAFRIRNLVGLQQVEFKEKQSIKGLAKTTDKTSTNNGL